MDPKLDTRFSEPDATEVPWSDVESVLRDAQLFWLTTVRRDGRPHVTPLVAVWLDGALHFSTGPDEQKGLNVHADARVALLTGSNTWDGGTDVVVEGTAERITERDTLERLAEAWSTKWDGSWRYEVTPDGFRHEGGDAHVFRVVPAKVLAFGKKPFSQTRFRP